ncbi:MAG TPA: protein kinase [Candidatus Eisenbacteria bacterium]|nr:protein kinase [Candidatus Eisenbacteria bacterium]
MAEKPVDESSRYAIQGEIGRGGMGQVLSAVDLRLGRPVAIKRIPEELGSDTQRLARLKREARALGKLNHPNIATIYSFEVTRSGSRLLILERVEGETLASRIRRGPLAVFDALAIAEQIAAALQAAHERGVVHRDLKPANVMVTPQGQVKILDFGLAKITEDPGETTDGSEDLDQTGPGLTIGTPGYMSPEQVRGLEADRRSDIFAFGCVLYECLTGARAFGGTPEQAMGRVLMRNPSWSALPGETPEEIRQLLARCLEKDSEKRLSEAREARAAIREVLGAPASAPSEGRHPLSGTRRFPVPLTSFVGRERELGEALDLLGHARILTLTGLGGFGKTRLASKLVERRMAHARGEVAWVDLASITEPERVPSAVAAALGIRESAGEWILDTLESHFAGRESLLVLDSCEHVLVACQGLATVLLSRAARLTILATSREPLRVEGEQVYPVPPLPTAAPRPKKVRVPQGGPMSDAARLFFDRALANRPDLASSGKELETVEEICRRLEGLPLAIELAAARTRVLTPAEILARLPDQIRLLAGGPPGAEPRHQALAATIRWSYDLLTPEERKFLRSLAVFTGGWTLEAAREIAQAADEFQTLEMLSRLVDKSLVLAEPSVGEQLRFRFLETVRQYALEELRRHGEEAPMRARHLEHYVRLAERAAPELFGPEQGTWLERLEADHENFLTALWWCRCAGGACDDVNALRIASRLWRFWFGQGHLELGRTVLRTVLALPGAAPASAERAEALVGAGALAFHQNDYDDGFARYEESLAIARERDDASAIGFALGGLGNLHMSRGDYGEARERYDSARAEFARAGHRRGEGLMVSNLGRLSELEGDLDRAHELSGLGISILREVGDIGSLALRLSSYAEESLRMGRVLEAKERLLECLAVVQELGEPHPGTYALERTAALLETSGDPRAAARLCGAADALRQRIGSPRSPKEKKELDELLLRLQRATGGTAFGEAWAEGRGLSFEGAIGEALRALEYGGAGSARS